jgi:hypothetical protein
MEVFAYIQNMNPTLYADTDSMNFYIELAEEEFPTNAWFGSRHNYAKALHAMHNYVISRGRPDGDAGLVTGKSEGNASIRYWNKVEKGRYSDLQMTHYGQKLLAMMKSRGPTISAVVGRPLTLPQATLSGE